MKIIADSSSTRTEWSLVEGDRVLEKAFTSGINPYFMTRREISHAIRLDLPEVFFRRRCEHVFFYGSGCANVEKNRIMEAFAAGNIDILVATTVVEVGINVPNATVMMIENAERFGLATLHQLRGRVGRGAEQSYCIFMNGSKKEKENARLNILLKSNDGFEIANEDLKLRGPGELTGVSQSGDFPFQIADIYRDADILRWADEDTDRIMEDLAGGREAEYREYLDYLQTVQNNKVDFRSI